jgi:predicted secreted hydrolase
VRHGIGGFSQKSADGQGSMYYSQPFYRVSGEVMLNGERVAVSGQAWLDREWSSQLLSGSQTGWDWFSLHLDSGARLMAFRLRGGGADNGDYLSGSWITPDGELTSLNTDALTLVPQAFATAAGHRVPVRWRLTLPEQGLELEIAARHANRWMNTSVPYWEGAVSVIDATSGTPRGQGYLEMTGY